MQPPSRSLRSSTSTRLPRVASSAALTSELMPLPTKMTCGSDDAVMAHSTSASTRSGLPEPPSILSGAARMNAPRGGS